MYQLQRISKNWFLKIFSLFLAALLWLTIASETNSVINRTVALEFQGIPSNLEITGETAREVILQLRGSSTLLNEISPGDIKAVISLEGQSSGVKVFTLSAQNVQTPFGIEVLRVAPPRIQFNLERTLSKNLPVLATIEGEPAEGHKVIETIVNPKTVQVVGPESSIRSLDALPTTAIQISGLVSDVQAQVYLSVLDPLIRFQSLSPYEVTLLIREDEVEKAYIVTIDPSIDLKRWSVEPLEINVTIRGPASLMSNYEPEFVYFTFDGINFGLGDQEISPIIIGITEPFHKVATVPERINIRVR